MIMVYLLTIQQSWATPSHHPQMLSPITVQLNLNGLTQLGSETESAQSISGSIPTFSLEPDEEVTEQAQQLYAKHQAAIFQIQVIDRTSGAKSSIGSGFQYTKDGHVGTNYHVISEALYRPERYRLAYVAHDGTTGTITLQHVDVIHDLAIVLLDTPGPHTLSLSTQPLAKGNHIYALGNPYDLGMTIVEGTYNGMINQSLYQKILFSGSLNSGMSGGPALNRRGEIIGINVSTAGNDISFMVPSSYLSQLHRTHLDNPIHYEATLQQNVHQQLLANQQRVISQILSSPWNLLPFGRASIADIQVNAFKCWGDSVREAHSLHDYSYRACTTEDTIYLSPSLSTGRIAYRFDWYDSDELSPERFYHLYSTDFGESFNFDNAGEKDTGSFQCYTEFVSMHGEEWKAAICARPYTLFPDLFDVSLSLALVSEYTSGLLAEIVALGVSEEMSLALTRQFMEHIRWND